MEVSSHYHRPYNRPYIYNNPCYPRTSGRTLPSQVSLKYPILCIYVYFLKYLLTTLLSIHNHEQYKHKWKTQA